MRHCEMNKFHGITLIRNGEALGYPYKVVIDSMKEFCDEVWVNVDPGEDDTLSIVKKLDVNVIESKWDMNRMDRGQELSRQANLLLPNIPLGDWVIYLQADEVIHPFWGNLMRRFVGNPNLYNDAGLPFTAFELYRAYFWRDLQTIRGRWSMYLARIFQRGYAEVTEDGMSIKVNSGRVFRPAFADYAQWLTDRGPVPFIYHYSRIGDPFLISKRVSILDGLFHPKETIPDNPPPYDFVTREFDCYSSEENPPEIDETLLTFNGDHPPGIEELYGSQR